MRILFMYLKFIVIAVISGFGHDVDENCAVLGYYMVSNGNPLPMFWDNISVTSSRVKVLDFLTL
jgi:hypothetical protein